MQDRLGVQLMTLVDDPQAASLRVIVAEAQQQLGSRQQSHHVVASGNNGHGTEHHSTGVDLKTSIIGTKLTHNHHWISPAPVSVKMRVFCLPYAGGVSENIYAR
jgi:hypothetical protein